MQIKKGDKGNEVADIQQRLVALGYKLGPTRIDGLFGRRTEKAVRSFQTDRDLPMTGIVNEETWRRMVDATYNLGDRALYLRSPFFHGDDVRHLQKWLNGIGFRTDQIDGIFGPSTEEAVREFQENVGITEDGIVGPTAVSALNNIRGMLTRNQNAPLMNGPAPNSVVSLLHDSTIAIGSSTPHKREWLAPGDNQQLFCADLSHRLSNLLEILGARTNFFKIRPDAEIDGEIAVAFRPGRGEVQDNQVAIGFDGTDEDSRLLADLVTRAIKTSLKGEIGRIAAVNGPGYGRPAIEVMPGKMPGFNAIETINKEVFKQKIAGAVFDGLKEFIRTKTSAGSPG